MSFADFFESNFVRNKKKNRTNTLSSPHFFLWSMFIFLAITVIIAIALVRQISSAFSSNPGLNGLIFGVLFTGVFLAFGQVIRLFREVHWFNSFQEGKAQKEPILLLPMKTMLSRSNSGNLSTASMKAILDSIANRLDESRDILRYLVGLLVFLGLLGTFWGLLGTISAIKDTLNSLRPTGSDTQSMFDTLKSGLSAPLSGMGTAFSSSLFGLSGSLILGFLDLQAGRAQNRFYTELENCLAEGTDLSYDLGTKESYSSDIKLILEKLRTIQKEGPIGERATTAIGTLAEGIADLVKNMLGEQQMIRNWVESQAQERKNTEKILQKIADTLEGKRHNEP